MIFQNRAEAGKKLAKKLLSHLTIELSHHQVMALAIPRGGVVIGKQIADVLNCPLEVIITKKIGAPGNPELAVGAVGMIGEPVIDEELAARVGADEEYLKSQIANLKSEIKRREKEFRLSKLPPDLRNKIVIITDDGVATGATMRAAVEVARQYNPKKIIVAVPVIAKDTLAKLEELADEVIYLEAPALFFAVGQFYKEFPQVEDEEVVKLLE